MLFFYLGPALVIVPLIREEIRQRRYTQHQHQRQLGLQQQYRHRYRSIDDQYDDDDNNNIHPVTINYMMMMMMMYIKGSTHPGPSRRVIFKAVEDRIFW